MTTPLLTVATIRYSDTNLVSGTSLTVLFFCVAVAFALSLKSHSHTLARQVTASIAVFLAIAVGCLALTVHHRGSDDMAAAITCIAFGFGYALSAFRGPSIIVSVVVLLESIGCVFLLSAMFVDNLHSVVYEYTDTKDRISDDYILIALCGGTATWAIYSFFLMLDHRQRSIAVLAERRADRCMCPSCLYDLRGSIGGSNCPECGKSIFWKGEAPHDYPPSKRAWQVRK